MASFPPDTCVACGGPAMPCFRRVVKKEVMVFVGQKNRKGGAGNKRSFRIELRPSEMQTQPPVALLDTRKSLLSNPSIYIRKSDWVVSSSHTLYLTGKGRQR